MIYVTTIAALIFVPIAAIRVDVLLGGNYVQGSQDVSSDHFTPLANLPGIFATIMDMPSFFTRSLRCSKPYEMMTPNGNTYHQGFVLGESISYSYPAEAQVKPFGYVILAWLSMCIFPALMVRIGEQGVAALSHYAVLGCNKLFGTRLQPFGNSAFLSFRVASILAHAGWVVISIPTSVVTLLVRGYQKVENGIVHLAHAISPKPGLINPVSSSSKPTHSAQMRTGNLDSEAQPLLQSNHAGVQDVDHSQEESLSELSLADNKKNN